MTARLWDYTCLTVDRRELPRKWVTFLPPVVERPEGEGRWEDGVEDSPEN